MKLSKTLLGTILVGLAVQTTGCKKGGEPAPKGEQVGQTNQETPKPPVNCPACGLG